jgi:TetR/AcrR family transcriptional regulator, cholesterol catabolism regulator
MIAARELFNERGIDGTSVRDINTRAGVSLFSLYHYFPSKDELTWCVLHSSFLLVADHVLPLIPESPSPTFGQLSQAFRMHAVRHMTVEPAGALSNANTRNLPESIRDRARTAKKEYEMCFRRFAQKLAEQGDVSSANLAVKVRMLLNAGIDTGSWYKPNGQLSVEAIADIYVDLCRAGLKA